MMNDEGYSKSLVHQAWIPAATNLRQGDKTRSLNTERDAIFKNTDYCPGFNG